MKNVRVQMMSLLVAVSVFAAFALANAMLGDNDALVQGNPFESPFGTYMSELNNQNGVPLQMVQVDENDELVAGNPMESPFGTRQSDMPETFKLASVSAPVVEQDDPIVAGNPMELPFGTHESDMNRS